jgi:mRNA interferase MazF
VTCERWDVVVVPFPFTDRRGVKRRPALVLSQAGFNGHGHTVLAMITSREHAPWPGDHVLANPHAAGLAVSCRVRLKLFTLDNRLLARRIGALSDADRREVGKHLTEHVG